MKVGDLVRFTAPSVFNAAVGRYAASGIVTDVRVRKGLTGSPKACYGVLWADGRRTREWDSYLEVLG